MLPPKDDLTICFAHAAYQLRSRFLLRGTGLNSIEAGSLAALERCVGDADVLVVSGLWHDGLIELAPKLRFIQAVSSGVDRFSQEKLRAHGIRLANAQGVNARAVSEHAMALILALARRLPEARDNQAKRFWRPMIGDLAGREDELAGKTLAVVGLGGIGTRLARLAKAFEMRVVAVRRDVAAGPGVADEVHAMAELPTLLPRVDFLVLTCPLTKETQGLVGTAAFAAMKSSAYLVNVARGRCVDEVALIEAASSGRIAGAAIDVTHEEPLPASSPLWAMANILITPHTAGETRSYEDTVIDYLMENLGRLWRGETRLHNEIV